MASALPGVVASKTLRPVIGVPCQGNYQGLDALLSIVQMPPGIPVLCVGVNKEDVAANAAVNSLKKNEKVVLVGDKSNIALRKAEDILRQFKVNHVHSDQLADNALNISLLYFDEPIE